MPYALLHSLLPALAERETGMIEILPGTPSPLPPGEYWLREMFCNERGCDCRRVMFEVVSSLTHAVEAVIAYGWESPQFYAKWLGDDDPEVLRQLQGPVLNLASRQSRSAPDILEMVDRIALANETYVERVKRHYAMFRAKVEETRRPAPKTRGRKPKPKKRRRDT